MGIRFHCGIFYDVMLKGANFEGERWWNNQIFVNEELIALHGKYWDDIDRVVGT